MKTTKKSRREFVKQSSLLAGSLMAMPVLSQASFFHATADDTIKVSLVGCGGRGHSRCPASVAHQTKCKIGCRG